MIPEEERVAEAVAARLTGRMYVGARVALRPEWSGDTAIAGTVTRIDGNQKLRVRWDGHEETVFCTARIVNLI